MYYSYNEHCDSFVNYLLLYIQEVDLFEASYYGLHKRIPALLTSVGVDAADSVSMNES